jgi:IS5 family transposase
MRRKRELILSFVGCDKQLPKTVREYRERYKGISATLDACPGVLDRIHRDLGKLSEGKGKGREGDFTSETILRALIVMTLEGLSYRDTIVRIAESEFLQDFIRTRKKAVMDHTFLNKCFKAIRPETWKRVNELLGAQCVERSTIDPSVIRVDTTVVETNIHWPTDASLLWDTWRVASRLLQRAREIDPAVCPHRFHDRKVKRLYLFVTRYSASPAKARQKKVKKAMRTLIHRVAWIVEIVEGVVKSGKEHASLQLQGIALQLEGFLPAMRIVIAQATRAAIRGEKVPARERVFSIFEPHTELIKRGRRNKPVEFGHAVLLCQTSEKFITDYDAFEEKPADCALTGTIIERHRKLFGTAPEVLAGDKGFCPSADEYAQLENEVETLAIPRRMRDLADSVMSAWQAFRAGIEGTISGLKRAFRLARCYFRTFKSFQASVGLGVFCHNLIVLSRQGSG